MSQQREDILRRIRALTSKTVSNGCTEAEAMSAAVLLAKLVDKFGFAPKDLEEPLEALTDYIIRADGGATGNKMYAPSVASYCDCKVFQRTVKGTERTKEIVFFGTEADVLMAKYIMSLLDTALKSGFKYYSKSTVFFDRVGAHNARKSYNVGFGSRVSVRLKEMKTARNQDVDTDSGKTGGALVVVKNAVVTEEFAKRFGRMSTGRRVSIGAGNRSAYDAGTSSGDRVAINPGVGGNAQLRIGG